MTALEESAAGNVIVKSAAVLVLSDPKSNTATLASAVGVVIVSLNIKQPLAVTVAVDHVESAKSINAVVPDDVGSMLVNTFPFAVYPVPLTSLVAL